MTMERPSSPLYRPPLNPSNDEGADDAERNTESTESPLSRSERKVWDSIAAIPNEIDRDGSLKRSLNAKFDQIIANIANQEETVSTQARMAHALEPLFAFARDTWRAGDPYQTHLENALREHLETAANIVPVAAEPQEQAREIVEGTEVPGRTIKMDWIKYGKLVDDSIPGSPVPQASGFGFTRSTVAFKEQLDRSHRIRNYSREDTDKIMWVHKLLDSKNLSSTIESAVNPKKGILAIRQLSNGDIVASRVGLKGEGGSDKEGNPTGRRYVQSNTFVIKEEDFYKKTQWFAAYLANLTFESDTLNEPVNDRFKNDAPVAFEAPAHHSMPMEQINEKARKLKEYLQYPKNENVVLAASDFESEQDFLEAFGSAVEALKRTDPTWKLQAPIFLGSQESRGGNWIQWSRRG